MFSVRTRILAAACLCLIAAILIGRAADRQVINVGTAAFDGTGDSLRVTQQKGNANFLELFSRTGSSGLSNANSIGPLVLTFLATNVNPVVSGAYIRLPNDTALYARNAADSANVQIVQVDSADRVYVDSGANGLVIGKNLTIAGTTNQIVFGATNTAPSTPGTIVKWVSVQVTGESEVYRIPLYK